MQADDRVPIYPDLTGKVAVVRGGQVRPGPVADVPEVMLPAKLPARSAAMACG